MLAEDSSQAASALRESIIAMLRLPNQHFIRKFDPLPSSLLAAAGIALLSEPRVQRLHGQLQRSLGSRSDWSAAAAATPPEPTAGMIAVESESPREDKLPPPNLPAEASSLIMGSPREQLHTLRAVLRNLNAKLADLGGEPRNVHQPGFLQTAHLREALFLPAQHLRQ